MFPIAIQAIENDDDKAFMERLYLEYHDMIRRNIFTLLPYSDQIDDFVNDVCIRLIKQVPVLRELEKLALTTYIINTARSVAVDIIRKQSNRSKYMFYGDEDDVKDEIPDCAKLPEDILLGKERRADIYKAFQSILEKDRFLLQFKYILNMSDAEIAKIFGISQNSVREYLTRARRKAQKHLAEVAASGKP